MADVNYKEIKIRVETRYGEDPLIDSHFTRYLDEYSISWSIVLAEHTESGWPVIEYIGGPISLTNMLMERFGYSREEIESAFPQIQKALE